ncbi:MAG: RNA polymerase sigma factor [Prevotella sp.]|nr:RNA polymerase sigma factor [Prevotella sp.]
MARAMSLLNDHDTAEDVSEEVLLKLWERHRDLHDDEDKVKHLANLMARNLSLNLLRQRRRHPIMRLIHWWEKEDDESSDIPEPFTPQQYVEDEETGDIVQRAMGQLPYNWRKIVEMREFEKMSYAEIAQVLGTSESSCRGMMSKARQKLLQLISKIT